MKKTRELKEKWSAAGVAIFNKLGVMEIDEEYLFLSDMITTALIDEEPLTDNEIETIEAHIRIKLFNHGLLQLV